MSEGVRNEEEIFLEPQWHQLFDMIQRAIFYIVICTLPLHPFQRLMPTSQTLALSLTVPILYL